VRRVAALKKLVIVLLKIGLSLAILVWLFGRALRGAAFDKLQAQFAGPGFHWSVLVFAFLSLFAAVAITFVRWYLLVRALDLPFSFRESIRLGFLGFLFNLAPMGIVGGDLLKAVMLARQQPRRRAQAVATVAVDRVIGLYVLFVVASAAILFSGFWRHDDPQVRYISLGTLAGTLLATAGMGALFIPGVTQGRFTDWLSSLPYAGRQIGHLIAAVRMYRNNPGVLADAVALSAGVHSLSTVGIYLITLGIYNGGAGDVNLAGEFVVVPLASATGVIPLVMGPLELVLDFLYVRVFAMAWGQGLVVALGYRILSLLIALVGVFYYFGARRELSAVMHEAEDAAPDDSPGSGPTTTYCEQPREAACVVATDGRHEAAA
jgi:hypothetical protein